MKLIRSGSTMFACSPQQSSSMVYPDIGRTGRLLTLGEAHLSGNAFFSIVTNNTDGCEWTQVGEEISVAVSTSVGTDKTYYVSRGISYLFYDTGKNVSDDPVCSIEFSTQTGCIPHENDGGSNVYTMIGFVTAPEDGIASIQLDDAGVTANQGTSWSSVRWTGMKWQRDNAFPLSVNLRQGGATVTAFSGDLDPKKTDPTNYRYTVRMTDLLGVGLDNVYKWYEAFTITNYPSNAGDGDNTNLKTMTTDSPIGTNGDLDHRIYAFIACGRINSGGEDDEVVSGKYRLWVE